MIDWWWLIPAVMAGQIGGVLIIALCIAGNYHLNVVDTNGR
jgi:hypothetical protein